MTHGALHPCQILSGSDKPIQRYKHALLSFRGPEKKEVTYIDDQRRAITVSRGTKIQTDSDSARRGGVPFDILSLKF